MGDKRPWAIGAIKPRPSEVKEMDADKEKELELAEAIEGKISIRKQPNYRPMFSEDELELILKAVLWYKGQWE